MCHYTLWSTVPVGYSVVKNDSLGIKSQNLPHGTAKIKVNSSQVYHHARNRLNQVTSAYSVVPVLLCPDNYKESII